MYHFFRYLLACILLLTTFLTAQSSESKKARLIVTTDFGQDPDDQQSMIRLFHYANDFHIVGLIANADGNYDHEPPELRTDLLYGMIEAYGRIYPNLKTVDPDYPSADALKRVVKSGCRGNGRTVPVFDFIGEGKSTEGSQWIIQQVDEADELLHISIWGGACDLAQALFDIRRTRTPEEVQRFIKKLRVYFIGKQDSSNPWIIDNFPELWLVLGMSYDGNSWNSSYRGIFLGGDMQLTSLAWLQQHVIGQHELGSLYPPKTWTKGGTKNPYGAMKEGDSPSFLYFLNNGLNAPERPEWGGWGGRFRPFDSHLYRDAEDTFYDVSVDSTVCNAKASVFRWRPDIQADFAARVQWGKGDARTVNHYPDILVNGDQSMKPLIIQAKKGENIRLTAKGSTDIDGDELSFEWMLYPEAGTHPYAQFTQLSDSHAAEATCSLPEKGQGSIHLILRVQDNAAYPLISYKRVIIQVGEEADIPLIIFDTDMGSDCDDVGALAILHRYLNQGKANLLACIYSSGEVPYGAGVIDAINTFYGRPDIPIGAEHGDNFGDPVDKMDAGKLAQDTTAFAHDIIMNQDAPEQTLLTRQLLAAQKDQSVIYITVGHTKALHDLLRSEADSISEWTGTELVQKKIKHWVALGGLKANHPNGHGAKDWNFFRNGTAPYTDYLLAHFPRPAYFINAGSDVLTGQSLVYSHSSSIVRTAYRDWLWKVENKTLSDGRPSWDLAAVCFALEGQSSFFDSPERGTLTFDLNNGSRWKKDENGTHYYVNQKKGIAHSFAAYLNSLME